MHCPNCGNELVDPPIYCKCGHDFRHKDSRTKYLVADRLMTFKELLFAPWKVRRNFRWVDKDNVIRKKRQWFLGVGSILMILGFGLAYSANPNVFGLAKSGILFKLFVLFILISFILNAKQGLSTRARDKGIIEDEIKNENDKDKNELKEMFDDQYPPMVRYAF